MYSVTPESTANLVRLTLSGKVSGKEYADICALLREALERNQPLDLFCELDGFRGIGLADIWRAARMATQNETNLRCVVGDRRRYKWARVLVRGFHAETRYFDQAHRTRAIRWLAKSTGRGATASSSGLLGDASYHGTIARPNKGQINRQRGRSR